MTRLATVLLIIGGLNWGLVGFFQYDLVAAIFGGQAALLSRLIYCLVGISAIYEIVAFRRIPADRTGLRTVEERERHDRAA